MGAGNSIPRYILKGTENICSHKNLCMNVQSSISRNSPKVETTQYPSTDEKKTRMCSGHTMEYCSPIKRNEVPIQATARMDLENITLSARCQHKRTRIMGFHRSAVFLEAEGRSVVARIRREWEIASGW